ncbi:MAG: hypothetical protein QM790_03250 [Nibricoccus sp.]
MNSSKKSNDQQKPANTSHHDALSGWGAIGGAVIGLIIGAFFGKAIMVGTFLGVAGWLIGGLIDRARK